MMELPLASVIDKDLVNFPFVRVVDDRWLRFTWALSSSRRCRAVEQSDLENIVFPECLRKV